MKIWSFSNQQTYLKIRKIIIRINSSLKPFQTHDNGRSIVLYLKIYDAIRRCERFLQYTNDTSNVLYLCDDIINIKKCHSDCLLTNDVRVLIINILYVYIYEVRVASAPPPTRLCTLRVFHYYGNDVTNDAKPFWTRGCSALSLIQTRTRAYTYKRIQAMSLCARAIASIQTVVVDEVQSFNIRFCRDVIFRRLGRKKNNNNNKKLQILSLYATCV